MSTEDPISPIKNGAPLISIVLPSYNEVRLLGSTVPNLIAGLKVRSETFEIVIVENGSRDRTLELARMIESRFDHVRTLGLESANYGSAQYAGFQAAKGTFVVFFDVDYYDLAFLDGAITVLRNKSADIVVASKRADGAQDTRPLLRRALTFGFTAMLRHLIHLRATDVHGMKAVRRSTLEPVVAVCVMRKSLFDVEMVVRATRMGLRLTEIPARVAERRPARSSVLLRVVESFWGVLRLRRVLTKESSRAARGKN